MTPRQPVSRWRALGALIVLVAVVVGAPAAILAAFGWPLTRGVLDVERWPHALTEGQVSDDAVLRVLVTVALGVLAYLLGCAAAEVVALARRRDRTSLARNPLSRWVRHLVAVAAVLVTTARPAVSLPGPVASAPPAAAVAPTSSPPIVPGVRSAASSSASSASSTVGAARGIVADALDRRPGTVAVEAGRRDSLYSLAVRHLGDGERRDELVELNRGRVMVDGSTFDGTVRPGYRILIPAGGGAAAAGDQGHERVHVVAPGDSLWSIAARLLGDGARHHEIHRANLGREVEPGVAYLATTSVLRPGWALVIPPSQPSPVAVEAPAPAAEMGNRHVVRRGESIWSIAADELGRRGDATSAADVAAFVDRLVEANAERFVFPGRPDLVRPGQELVLPPTVAGPAGERGPASAPEASAAAPDPASENPPPSTAAPPTAARSDAVPSAPTPPETTSPSTAAPSDAVPSDAVPSDAVPADAVPASPEGVPATVVRMELAPVDPVVVPAAPVDSATPAPAATEASPDTDLRRELAGLAGAVVLASGALAVAARLRHQRLNRRRPGTRIDPPPAVVARAERELRLHADVELARWGPLALRHLAPSLGAVADGGFPLVASVALDGDGVAVTWSSPRPTAVAPWRSLDGGAHWRVDRVALPDPRVADEVVPPCPGLVTVAMRSGSSLLLDLESAGVVAVTGRDERVAAFARAAVLELAVSDFADLLDIRLVGLPEDGFEHLRRVRAVASLDQAMAWARPVRAATDELLAAERTSSLFELRARGANAVTHEPLVLVVSPALLDAGGMAELIEVCRPGHGVAAVVLGPVPGAPVEVRVDDLGGATIDRAGRSGETGVGQVGEGPAAAPQVPEATIEAVGALLAHAAGADERAEPIPLPRRDGAPFDEPPAAVEVRLLGPVAIGAIGAEDWDDLEPRTLELVAWLATRDSAEPLRRAAADVWSGRLDGAMAACNHHLVLARTRLGSVDGRMVLPPASDGRVRLDAAVTTDLARLERRVRWASSAPDDAAVAVLRAGLTLVRGRPFGARSGYDWAHADQLVFRAEQSVVDAAHRMAQLCLARRDADGAVWATTAGLRGRPGDETLYQLRMRAFAALGNRTSVRTAMDELCSQLQLLAGVDEPSEETSELYELLMGRERSA